MTTLARRRLIVNADDLGQSPGVNRGVRQAVERGIVTSASLMVRWPAAREAAAWAGRHPAISVGLHLDLGEWRFRDGQWVARYHVVELHDAAAIATEAAQQLAAFEELLGRPPTHLDSHQHVHLREPTRSVILAVARDRGLPVRGCQPAVRYCGDFYGQTAEGDPWPHAITVEGLLQTLAGLPAGLTELGCHPGEGDDLDTTYRGEREVECRTLCDPRVRAAIAALDIELCSFADLPGRGSP